MQEALESLTDRHAHLCALSGTARACADESSDVDVTGAAEIMAGVLRGDLPQSAGERALAGVASATNNAATVASKRAAWLETAALLEAEAAEVAGQIQARHAEIRAQEKARLQALANQVRARYIDAVGALVAALSEAFVVADKLAPHCLHSIGNIMPNDQWLRARGFEIFCLRDMAPLETGVTPQTLADAKARLFKE